jgi:hypothetical protein
VEVALQEGIPNLTGVRFCLNRLLDPTPLLPPLDLTATPDLAQVGQQPLSLTDYDQLLTAVAS